MRFLGVFLAVLIGVGLFLGLRNRGQNPGDDAASQTLHICTWSNYYPPALIEAFTKETGIRVQFSYMSSNEELFAKMRAGASGFDLVQPSDYMVAQMARLGMLSALDKTQLPNETHLDPFFTNQSYDPGLKHSIPFAWGTTGIAVNTEKVPVKETSVSWKLLFDSPAPKQTSALDDMREVFVGALLLQGKPMNSKSPADLAAAQAAISELKSRVLMFSSEPRPLLLKEEITVAHVFSTDAIHARMENPKIRYFIPREGGTLWTDNFSIPATAKHAKAAHRFINYFLDPEKALQLITENNLSTPNKTAREKLPAENKNDPSLYPSAEVMKTLHFLEDLGPAADEMMRLWTELRS